MILVGVLIYVANEFSTIVATFLTVSQVAAVC